VDLGPKAPILFPSEAFLYAPVGKYVSIRLLFALNFIIDEALFPLPSYFVRAALHTTSHGLEDNNYKKERKGRNKLEN
jgi:hypothetical protein